MSTVNSTTSGSNTLRITGMASGLDVDAMVEKMMSAEQIKIDKAQQAKQIVQWKQEAYQDIIKDIKELQNSFFDSTSSDKNILAPANYAGFNVTGEDSDVATITAGVGAQTGSYKVSVGTGASIANTLAGSSLTSKLTDINAGLNINLSLVLNVNGSSKTITLDNTGGAKTIGDLVNAINSQGGGAITAAFDDVTDKFSLTTSTVGGNAQLTVESATTDLLSNILGALNEGTPRYGTSGLASKASTVGSDIVKDTSNGYTAGNWSGKKIGFSIGGGTVQEITITTGADIAATLANINTQINSNSTLKGKVQAVVSGTNIQFQALSDSSVKIDSTKTTVAGAELDNLKGRVINPSTSTTLAELGLTDATDSFQITFNGTTKTISVKSTDKLSDVINNISTTTSGALTASFSQLAGKFMIQSTSTGSSQSISIATGTGTGKALAALGVSVGAGTPGTDATVTITPPGGTATTIIKSTNNFTIDGISYNLTGGGTSTVTVGADNNKVYDKIKSFIDKYNTIIDKIQTKLTEKKNYSYTPLTDAQKEEMEESQITSWETKAKQGILKNDSNLQTMLNNLRSAFTTAVSGTGFTMGRYGSSSIGLDTSQDNDKPGHIDIVDASKLKAAIATNGEQIFKMFANVSTSTNATTAYNENGIFARIKNILQDNVGYTNTTLNTAILTKYANKQDDFSITGSSGTGTLPNQIYQKQLIIDKLKETFYDKQEAYYQKFASLETAMNNLNSQQSWLTQQFSS